MIHPIPGILCSFGSSNITPETIPNLRSYWHGDDISGSDWPARAGSQATTVVGGGTSGAWTGHGHNALLTARKQVSGPAWDVDGVTPEMAFLFVSEMNFGGGGIGPCSGGASGGGNKFFPLACFSGSNDIVFSPNGSTLHTMWASKGSWSGLPFALVISQKTTSIEAWMRINGADEYVLLTGLGSMSPGNSGICLGGWYDSGGEWNKPLGALALIGSSISSTNALGLIEWAKTEFSIS